MIDEKKFEKILDEVINNNDKVIVLYSGLWTFINKIKFKNKSIHNIPKYLLDLIEKKIGKKKTLFLPAFTGQTLLKKKVIHLDKDIDKNGLISLEGLKRKYYRTRLPVHSYLVYGNTNEIEKIKFTSSWGKNSLLEYFSKKNARICNLGLPWNRGCAYLHRFEYLYNVPWRYEKKISAKFFYKNKFIGEYYEIKHCSSMKRTIKYDFKPFIKFIKKSKSFKKSKNKNLSFESIKVSCLNKIGNKIFSKDPWIIIKNKKKTINWIKKEKEDEIKNFN